MKSIRLSLIVYFLVLIALALGGVSTLVYQTASKTLRDKQISTEDLVWTQFHTRRQEARAALDRRLLRQALLLASKARSVQPPYETVYFPAIALGQSASALGAVQNPLWISGNLARNSPRDIVAPWDAFAAEIAWRIRQKKGIEILVPSADDYLAMDDDHAQEFFQIYRPRGFPVTHWVPVQRSASLKDQWFSLGQHPDDHAELFAEQFDDLEFNGM